MLLVLRLPQGVPIQIADSSLRHALDFDVGCEPVSTCVCSDKSRKKETQYRAVSFVAYVGGI